MPNLYIIAGCNGAGKTTSSSTILPEVLNCKEFINADEIARELFPDDPESLRAGIQAGRSMLKKINALLITGVDFALETTLSTRSYVSFINKAKNYGYKVTLLFFWLESPAMAKDRVAVRVVKGGHNIPADVIVRRYYSGIKNLFDLYMPICDEWMMVNNTIGSKIIAEYKSDSTIIFNQSIWNMMTSQTYVVREAEMPYGPSPTHIFDKIRIGLKKSYRKLVTESAANNESLVVLLDGEVKHVPATELLRMLDETD